MTDNCVYHEGELAVQAQNGVATAARLSAAAIQDRIPQAAMAFIAQQSMAVIGSLDAQGNVWASLVFGQPGFLRTGDGKSLWLQRSQCHIAFGDPLWRNLEANEQLACISHHTPTASDHPSDLTGRSPSSRHNAVSTTSAPSSSPSPLPNQRLAALATKYGEKCRLGILLIELGTRRRLRINGNVQSDNARSTREKAVRIQVEQAYANCSKYIQRRSVEIGEPEQKSTSTDIHSGQSLNSAQQAWISGADTFFVASAHPSHGADVSHRGGHPGFVKLLSAQRLRIPDFTGNNMFNTLGNFTSYPHAGLVFFDFDRGKVLQLCGRPEIYSQQADEPGESDGTARFWEFQIECWRESNLPIQVKSRFVDYSPFLPRTCKPDSTQAKQTLLLKVAHTWMASPRIKCFELVSENGAPLPPFHAGAHLTLDLPIRQGSLETRHYSLLSDPACRTYYRIGVLAEPHGRGGSLYLHQQIRAGDTLRAQTPVNHFQLTPGARHSILIAGGIGITPLLSMLYTLKSENRSFELHYSAKQPPDLAFRREIEKLAGPQAHFYTSQNPSQASLDLESIINTPVAHAHIYVCGPYRLIQTVRMQASTMGWLPEQIHFESFGATNTASDQAITVTLAKTGRTIHIPAKRSILDALLDEGIAVPHECKRGECSLCVTRVLKGNVQHRDLCLNPDEQKNAMCLCVSRTSTPYLTLDL